MAVVWVISAYCIYFTNADKLHKIAASGISFGVIGAAILYYETIVSDQDLIIIGNQIASVGRSKKLSKSDKFFVASVSLIIGLSYLYGVYVIVHKYLYGANEIGLYTTVQRIFLLCVVWAVFVIITYGYAKAFRILTYRWHKTIEDSHDDARKVVIKHILRRVGFASLVLSGALQFPATLF